jgi:hypothetical protein
VLLTLPKPGHWPSANFSRLPLEAGFNQFQPRSPPFEQFADSTAVPAATVTRAAQPAWPAFAAAQDLYAGQFRGPEQQARVFQENPLPRVLEAANSDPSPETSQVTPVSRARVDRGQRQ